MPKNTQLPSFGEKAFICPYCKVFSQQKWVEPNAVYLFSPTGLMPKPFYPNEERLSRKIKLSAPLGNRSAVQAIFGLNVSFCSSCEEGALWKADELIYPISGRLPPPADEMPEIVLKNYLEASAVAAYSTDAAAALLRLALQNLLLQICKNAGSSKANKHTPLGKLIEIIEKEVENGPFLIKAMHKIRKAGNDAVHPTDDISSPPGEIIPAKTEEIDLLAQCLNLITEQLALIKKIEE